MDTLLFGRLRKIEEDDDGTLHVSGVASSEVVDRAGEIMLASAVKAALPDFFANGSGAMREMHGRKAAGKIDRAEVDAKGRTVVEGTVVDPIAIKKVRMGVYKGFSLGGRVLERDKKNRKIITKIELGEISLVDRPANPEAVVSLWKADGFVAARRDDIWIETDRKLSKLEADLLGADFGAMNTVISKLNNDIAALKRHVGAAEEVHQIEAQRCRQAYEYRRQN